MQGRGDQENVFSISAEEWQPAQSARDTILGLVEVPEAGKIYKYSCLRCFLSIKARASSLCDLALSEVSLRAKSGTKVGVKTPLLSHICTEWDIMQSRKKNNFSQISTFS